MDAGYLDLEANDHSWSSILVKEPTVLRECIKWGTISLLAIAAITLLVSAALTYFQVGALAAIGNTGIITMVAAGGVSLLVLAGILRYYTKPAVLSDDQAQKCAERVKPGNFFTYKALKKCKRAKSPATPSQCTDFQGNDWHLVENEWRLVEERSEERY